MKGLNVLSFLTFALLVIGVSLQVLSQTPGAPSPGQAPNPASPPSQDKPAAPPAVPPSQQQPTPVKPTPSIPPPSTSSVPSPAPIPQQAAPTPMPTPTPFPSQALPLPPALPMEQFEMPQRELPPGFQNAEGYNYDPTGKRDPFKPFGQSQATQAPDPSSKRPTEPLEMYDVAQFKLVGVIWNVRAPKAMVRDPSGKLHMVKKETKIGRNNGFVAAIREGEIIVVEPTVGENGMQTAVTRVLNLKP